MNILTQFTIILRNVNTGRDLFYKYEIVKIIY